MNAQIIAQLAREFFPHMLPHLGQALVEDILSQHKRSEQRKAQPRQSPDEVQPQIVNRKS